MMVAMVQASEYLTIRCHNAFCCQSPQMAMTRLRNGFEAAIVCELVNRIPLQRSSRPDENVPRGFEVLARLGWHQKFAISTTTQYAGRRRLIGASSKAKIKESCSPLKGWD